MAYAKSTASAGDYTLTTKVEAVFTYTAVVNGVDSTTSTRAIGADLPDATLTVTAPPVPATPQGLTATSGDRTMTLRWNNATDANDGYDYRYATSLGGLLTGVGVTEGRASSGPGVTDFTFEDDPTTTEVNEALTVGLQYYFQVRGRHLIATTTTYGDWSTPASQIQLAAPVKLAGLTATLGNRQVKLDWADPPAGDNVISYDYRQDSGDGNGWGGWQNVSTPTSDYTVTGLVNGTTHSFQVRAQNATGEGPESDPVTATPRRSASTRQGRSPTTGSRSRSSNIH